MAKKYLLLNFSDFLYRGTPTIEMREAIGRRAGNKNGTLAVYEMADILAAARTDLGAVLKGNALIQGILDASMVRQLMLQAQLTQKKVWNDFVIDCIGADKILFAAHGLKHDTENVYCEHADVYTRCGDLKGVAIFLDFVLERAAEKATLTLVVCYAARSENHQRDHELRLRDEDIRSSLAFKLFRRLAGKFGSLRMTARTGAVSGEGTSLFSQTEDAIVASEILEQEFPNNSDEQALVEANQAYREFDESLNRSELTNLERSHVRDLFDEWFKKSDPNTFDALVSAIDNLDWAHHKVSVKAARLLCCCCGVDSTWYTQERDAIEEMRRAGGLRNRLDHLKTRGQAKETKYGKFIYERSGGAILVSRMVRRRGEWGVDAVTEIEG